MYQGLQSPKISAVLTAQLYFYRKIIEQAGDYLMPEGMLFFEIGWNQADDVCHMLEKNGFGQVHVKKDLAGLDRIVYAVK